MIGWFFDIVRLLDISCGTYHLSYNHDILAFFLFRILFFSCLVTNLAPIVARIELQWYMQMPLVMAEFWYVLDATIVRSIVFTILFFMLFPYGFNEKIKNLPDDTWRVTRLFYVSLMLLGRVYFFKNINDAINNEYSERVAITIIGVVLVAYVYEFHVRSRVTGTIEKEKAPSNLGRRRGRARARQIRGTRIQNVERGKQTSTR